MTIKRIAVKRHFGIETLDLTLLGHDQRVDFQHVHVFGDESGIKLGYHLFNLLGLITGKFQRFGNRTAMMRHDAGGRIHRKCVDQFRRMMGDVFNVDPAFGGSHKRHPRGDAVNQNREIELFLDVGTVFDIKPVNLLTRWTGLDCYQCIAQHFVGKLGRFSDAFGKTHAALFASGSFFEFTFAASASVNLAFHHIQRAGKLLCRSLGFGCLEHRHARRNRHAKLFQNRLGLIFMDIHARIPL